jgi:CrcB protein
MNPPSTFTATLIVALGGALGAALRFQAGRLIGVFTGPEAMFPWPTFWINVLGSLAMGVLAGWLARNGQGSGEAWRLLLGVGVLGGFTTFSAFSLEIVALIQRGMVGLAITYGLASLIAGAVGLFAGMAMMRGTA